VGSNDGILLKLHHIGYVVRNISSAATEFAQSLSAQWDGVIYSDPLQRVKVTFLTLISEEPQLELVEPAGENDPVSRFLEQKGGGLHHLCYEVLDLEKTIASLRSKGSLLAKPPRPAVAFGNRKIAWVFTKENLLIELLEQTPKSEPAQGAEA
jgi:methylmalonyl-CoA/ethylmalonyl-CoA epimerase